MQAGADPNAEDEAGARPIDAAASMQESGVVELLLPLTTPAPTGDWTVPWLLKHAEPPPSAEGHHCGCGHSHEPGHEHAHGPHVDEEHVRALALQLLPPALRGPVCRGHEVCALPCDRVRQVVKQRSLSE